MIHQEMLHINFMMLMIVYENSKTVVIEYDDYSLSGDSIELTFDLDNNTLSDHYLVFEKQ